MQHSRFASGCPAPRLPCALAPFTPQSAAHAMDVNAQNFAQELPAIEAAIAVRLPPSPRASCLSTHSPAAPHTVTRTPTSCPLTRR